MRKRRPVADRFWEKVKVAGPDECWEWQGYLNVKRRGYGMLNVDGIPEWAHRVSYQLHYPDENISGKVIMHSCDNPPCVNPKHLSAGTHKDNSEDAWCKGRAVLPTNAPKGETHHSAKLTESIVASIRIRLGKGEKGSHLAKEFGVTKTVVSRIKRGKSWKLPCQPTTSM
jgi:hypothetical protein